MQATVSSFDKHRTSQYALHTLYCYIYSCTAFGCNFQVKQIEAALFQLQQTHTTALSVYCILAEQVAYRLLSDSINVLERQIN